MVILYNMVFEKYIKGGLYENIVYDNVNTDKEEGWYWSRPVSYERKYASCGVQANFNVYESYESK